MKDPKLNPKLVNKGIHVAFEKLVDAEAKKKDIEKMVQELAQEILNKLKTPSNLREDLADQCFDAIVEPLAKVKRLTRKMACRNYCAAKVFHTIANLEGRTTSNAKTVRPDTYGWPVLTPKVRKILREIACQKSINSPKSVSIYLEAAKKLILDIMPADSQEDTKEVGIPKSEPVDILNGSVDG